MTEGRKILYRAVQWVTSVFRRWFEPEAEEITLPSGRYELAAEAMYALTQAVEAAVSIHRTEAVDKTAVEVVSLLSRSMTCVHGGESNAESLQLLQEAVNKAHLLAEQGYKGYAQTLGKSVTFSYHVPPGVTEGLVLPELLRSYGSAAEQPLARLARETGIVDPTQPDDRTARLFISWMEQQRVVLGLPDHIKQLRQADIEDIIDDAFEEAAPMYPVPVLYDAIELEKFLAPLLASNKSKID